MSRRLRFRLSSLFGVMALLAIAASALLTQATWVSGFVTMFLVASLPGLLIVGSVHCRDYVRAACVGGCVPLLACVMLLVNVFSDKVGRFTHLGRYYYPLGAQVGVEDDGYLIAAMETVNAYRLPIMFFWGLAIAAAASSAALRWFLNRGDENLTGSDRHS